MDTVGNQHFDPNSGGVPNSGASGIFWCGMHNWAVEYNVGELSFAVRWQGMLSRG